MGSRNKYFGVHAADHGFDDIGLARPTGSFSGATLATKYGPRFAGKTMIVLSNTAVIPKKGSVINLTSSDTFMNSPTRILSVIPGGTNIIVNRTFQTPTAGTGTFDYYGGEGAWDGFMPMGGNVTGANLTLTFWDSNQEGGIGPTGSNQYLEGQKYFFSGTIKTALLASSGNIRLFRSATLRPRGGDAQ